MKLLKLALPIFMLVCSAVVIAQTLIEEEQGGKKTELQLQGCGYSRPIRVAGMIGNPPFGWVVRHDESGSRDLESFGLGRQILDKLAEKLKISYVSTGFLSYNKAINALKKGDIDLLLTAYYRPQDLGAGTTILIPGYFRNVFTVYFKKGKEFPVKSFDDLEGAKGVVRREENIYPLIYQKLPKGADITQVSTAKRAFEMLMNNEVDYLFTSSYSAEAELRRYKLNDEIVSGSTVLFDPTLFFVFTTNSDCWKLKEKFSKALRDEDLSPARIEEMARNLIDEWGEKFRDDPGLLEKESNDKD